MDPTKIALSGINAANQKLANTSNNIANSETVGFKETDMLFHQMVISNGSQGSGIGVSGGAVQTTFTGGSMVPTGDPLHHAISGDGYFVVHDSNGNQLLTKNGAFLFDENGNLVDGNGNEVQGYPSGSDTLETIQLDSTPLPPVITDEASMTANFGTDGDPIVTSIPVYDSIGEKSSMVVTYDNKVVDPTTGEATWTVTAEVDGVPVTLPAPAEVKFDANGELVTGYGLVDANGKIEFDLSTLTPPLAGVSKIEMDISKSTGYAGDNEVNETISNGRTYSKLDNYKVEANGTIVFSYEGGETKEVAQIAIATVENQHGLTVENNGYYTTTQTSGQVKFGLSGDSGFGTMHSGYLEGSNVDMTEQLVDLISSQQYYQANSKVLGVVDENNQALMAVI